MWFYARWRRRALSALVFALAALAAVSVRVPLDTQLTATFPHHEPRALAHFLADFTNHRRLEPGQGVWHLERESNALSTWQYAVRYECGARCSGQVEFTAVDGREHRLLVKDERCTHLPLLSMRLCEQLEVRTKVFADGAGGAVLEESARGWCGLALWLSGADACSLGDARTRRLGALREALPYEDLSAKF